MGFQPVFLQQMDGADTVDRDWKLAKAWLLRELAGSA